MIIWLSAAFLCAVSAQLDENSQTPRRFTFSPEVLRKFRIVMKRIFNFDGFFESVPSALVREYRPSNVAEDRQYLEETAEIPTNPYEQRRQNYERYLREYYYRQLQTSQLPQRTNYQWNQHNYDSSNGFYGQQQQTFYNPQQSYGQYGQTYGSQQYYGQQYGFPNFGFSSGLNFGGLGIGLNSGLGMNFGK